MRPELCITCRTYREKTVNCERSPTCCTVQHAWDAGRAEGEREGRAGAFAQAVDLVAEVMAQYRPPVIGSPTDNTLPSLVGNHTRGVLLAMRDALSSLATSPPAAPAPDDTARRLLAELVAAGVELRDAATKLNATVPAGPFTRFCIALANAESGYLAAGAPAVRTDEPGA